MLVSLVFTQVYRDAIRERQHTDDFGSGSGFSVYNLHRMIAFVPVSAGTDEESVMPLCCR